MVLKIDFILKSMHIQQQKAYLSFCYKKNTHTKKLFTAECNGNICLFANANMNTQTAKHRTRARVKKETVQHTHLGRS